LVKKGKKLKREEKRKKMKIPHGRICQMIIKRKKKELEKEPISLLYKTPNDSKKVLFILYQ